MRSSRVTRKALQEVESRAAVSQAIRSLYLQAASNQAPSATNQLSSALQSTIRWTGLETSQLQSWAGGLVQQFSRLPYVNYSNQINCQPQPQFSNHPYYPFCQPYGSTLYQNYQQSQQLQGSFRNFGQNYDYNPKTWKESGKDTNGYDSSLLGVFDQQQQQKQQQQCLQFPQQHVFQQRQPESGSILTSENEDKVLTGVNLTNNKQMRINERITGAHSQTQQERNVDDQLSEDLRKLEQSLKSPSFNVNAKCYTPYFNLTRQMNNNNCYDRDLENTTMIDVNSRQENFVQLPQSNQISDVSLLGPFQFHDFKLRNNKQQKEHKKERQKSAFSINREIMKSQSIVELQLVVNSDQEDMNFINISSALARIPKIVDKKLSSSNLKVQNLIYQLLYLMRDQIDQFDARGLANTMWTLGKLEFHPGTHYLDSLCEHAIKKIDEFNPQNLANFMWALVYLGHRNEDLALQVKQRALQCIHQFGSQQLSNLAWAYANSGYYYPDLFAQLCYRATQQLYEFNEQEMANIVWSCATLGHFDEYFCSAIAVEVSQRIQEVAPQGVSNLVWSFANLNYFDLHFMNCSAWRMAQCAHQATPQALSNVIWGYAVFKYRDCGILNILIQECQNRISQFSAQNISNLLWSIAVLDYRVDQFLVTASPWIAQTLTQCSEQGLCNVAWAYATLQFYDQNILNALALATKQKVGDVAPQGLSILPWSFASLEYWDQELFDQIAEQSIKEIDHFQDQNFSNLAWALMHIGHYHERLFDCLVQNASHKLEQFSIQSVLNMIQSFAKLRHPLGSYKHKFLEYVEKSIDKMGEMELCMTAWSLALSDDLSPEMFQRLCQQVLKQPYVSAEGLQQLMHAELAVNSKMLLQKSKTDRNQGNSDEIRLPKELRELAVKTWKGCADRVTISNFQCEVYDVMTRAGYECKMETLTEDGLFSIDITCNLNGKKVAVEVDGVHHFTRNTPRRVLGDSALRNRMLAVRGWNVVVIPFYMWNSFNKAQQEEFVKEIMDYAVSDQKNRQQGKEDSEDLLKELVFRAI